MNWIRLSGSTTYVVGTGWIKANARQLSEMAAVRTYVSLGPGDANIDLSILTALAYREPLAKYIPVDISEPLLLNAITLGSRIAKVPIGILTDFEDHFGFMVDRLKKYGQKPFLFGLLGGTLGNLDNLEDIDLLDNFSAHMAVGDYLLLEVSVKAEGWSFEADPRSMLNDFSKEYKEFVAYGVARKFTQESLAHLVDHFGEEFEVRSADHANITNSTYLEFWHKRCQWKVTRVCRYSWEHLLEFLKRRYFTVVDAPRLSQGSVFQHGMVLVVKERRR